MDVLMRRSLVVIVALSLTACSLVFGIYDNHEPIDAAPDAIVDATPDVQDAAPEAAPPNGCGDASGHAFCEFFDESPQWPSGGAMMTQVTSSPSLTDASCASAPLCLTAKLTDGYVSRTVPIAASWSDVSMDFRFRWDAMTNAPVTRVGWIDVNAGGKTVTFGMTLTPNGSNASSFAFWVLPASNTADNKPLVPTIGKSIWHEFRIDLDVGTGLASFFDVSSQTPGSFALDVTGVPITATNVTSFAFHVGQDTSMNESSVTVDSVIVDVQ